PAAARKLGVAAELARRNPAPEDAEFTADQVAYALAESRGRADTLIDLAQDLETRLPGTAAALLEVAPEKAKERREAAAKDARVERWAEDSGNAALMGCELPPDEVLAA